MWRIDRLRRLRIGGMTMLAMVMGLALVVGAPATEARAETCTSTVSGSNGTGASFRQQATFDFCDGHIARVGVRVTPFSGYQGSHVVNCVAHLELTDITLGATTRSDRPVNCTTKARSGAPFSVGPSRWTGQNKNHAFRIRAFVNLETSAGYYNSEAGHSRVEAVSCSNTWTRQLNRPVIGESVSGWYTTAETLGGPRQIRFRAHSGYYYYKHDTQCNWLGQKAFLTENGHKVRECAQAEPVPLGCYEYPGPGANDWYTTAMTGCPPVTSTVIESYGYAGCDGYLRRLIAWN
jgi:hypothetical protein